ncbi:MAG: hypothetical protein D6733_02190 [Methanobacteriota archaeon]|nr:MAG: hypothetical protein D6733_02190 [Euryarchaeota archaeon]
MGTEADIIEIKQYLRELDRKVDELLEEKEIVSIMRLSEKALSGFVSEEPEIYSIKDLKVRYR